MVSLGTADVARIDRGEHRLENALRTRVRESLVEHEPLDDPAPKAERVESALRVAVQRLGIHERLDR
jgi:cell wall assembly regulator SMI1